MRIAVLGGGYQGVCVAIELARRGAQVTLYDRNPTLLSRAATANEGKIHLGYVYGGDRSLQTARMMLRGAMPFASLMRRFLDTDAPFGVGRRYVYAVHRTSLYSLDILDAYYAAVHELVAVVQYQHDYFGIDLRAPPSRLTRSDLDNLFNGQNIVGGFATDEIAIDSVALAVKLRERTIQEPRIELRVGHNVTAVEGEHDQLIVRSTVTADDADCDTFNGVVNALWEGRIAIDATRHIHPGRKWVHRCKHGIRFQALGVVDLPSVTVSLGPYGDFVNYGNGNYFLSWYPACMTSRSDAIEPPVWPDAPDEPLLSQMVTETFSGMSQIVPRLGNIKPVNLLVKSGVIFAWGDTDIDDCGSELHSRHEIGVQSHGCYHTINPGKLTMTPHFAQVCADRILPHPR
jgi:glycine/D-amino acid oxidase-like deaminating enzyme